MVGVLRPVVLVIAQSEAGLLLHAQYPGQLEIAALVLVARGLANPNEAAAAPDELLHRRGDSRVLPDRPAGVGGVPIPHVDEYVDAVQHTGVGLDVIEADKPHLVGSSGQGLDHPGVGVILLLVQGVMDHVAAPGPGLAPGVEDGHRFDAVGGGPLDVVVELPELVADALYIVNERGEPAGQLQIAAVADAVDGFS